VADIDNLQLGDTCHGAGAQGIAVSTILLARQRREWSVTKSVIATKSQLQDMRRRLDGIEQKIVLVTEV